MLVEQLANIRGVWRDFLSPFLLSIAAQRRSLNANRREEARFLLAMQSQALTQALFQVINRINVFREHRAPQCSSCEAARRHHASNTTLPPLIVTNNEQT